MNLKSRAFYVLHHTVANDQDIFCFIYYIGTIAFPISLGTSPSFNNIQLPVFVSKLKGKMFELPLVLILIFSKMIFSLIIFLLFFYFLFIRLGCCFICGFSHRNIFKVCLTIFQHDAWKG